MLDLVVELQRQGVDVELVSLSPARDGLEEEARGSGVPTTVLPPLRRWRRVVEVRRILRQRRPDIVHATLPAAVRVVGVASIGLGAAVVSSVTSAVSKDLERRLFGENWRRRAYFAGYRVVSRLRVDRFHAITASTARVMAPDWGIDHRKVRVVERGRDLRRLGSPSAERRARVRASLGIAPGTPLVVVGARLSTQKNLTALIAAFARVVERLPGALLLIAGRDDDDSATVHRAAAPLVAAGAVRLLGFRADLPDLLAAADATALSSLVEGGAGVLIEAMALGVPVVSTEIDGLASVLVHGDNALVTPQGDPEAMAAALVAVLTDAGLAARLGAAGRRSFEERFTIDGAAARMIGLYREASGSVA